MSERKRDEFEDDGRTIADMSGVSRRNLFGFDPNSLRSAAGVEQQRPNEPVRAAEDDGLVIGYIHGADYDCLYADPDYSTWYVDRLGDLRCDAVHHDGTNHYLYRAYKDGVRESQIDLLKDKLYRGIATRADVTRITRRLGDDIARVYGFPIPRARQTAALER